MDDYSVHLCPKVKAALFKKRHFLIVIGRSIAGDLEVNDRLLQTIGERRKLEQELISELLTEQPNKFPRKERWFDENDVRYLVKSVRSSRPWTCFQKEHDNSDSDDDDWEMLSEKNCKNGEIF